MHSGKNDQDMKKILQRMYREDNREQIREIRTSYDEANFKKIRRQESLTENPTRIR